MTDLSTAVWMSSFIIRYFLCVYLCWAFIVVCGLHLLWCMGSKVHGLSSCSAWAQLLHGMWDLSGSCGILVDHVGPEIRLMSPELESRFLASGPWGKSLSKLFLIYLALSLYLYLECAFHFPIIPTLIVLSLMKILDGHKIKWYIPILWLW